MSSSHQNTFTVDYLFSFKGEGMLSFSPCPNWTDSAKESDLRMCVYIHVAYTRNVTIGTWSTYMLKAPNVISGRSGVIEHRR